MGIFRFDRGGQIVAFEEKPIGRSTGRDRPEHLRPAPRSRRHGADKPFIASMGIYVFSRDVLLDMLAAERAQGLRPRGDSVRARPLSRQRLPVPRLLGRRRHDRLVLRGEHHADAAGRAVQVLRSAPADLHASALSSRARASATARCATRSSPRAASSTGAGSRNRSSASAPPSSPARTIRRSVLLGADYYEADDAAPARGDAAAARHRPRRRARSRDRRQERAHRRRRAARERVGHVDHADGDGYYIRNGIIIVPKDGVIPAGFRV